MKGLWWLMIFLGAVCAAPQFYATSCDSNLAAGYSLRALHEAWTAAMNTSDVVVGTPAHFQYFALCSTELEIPCDSKANVIACNEQNTTSYELATAYSEAPTEIIWTDVSGAYPVFSMIYSYTTGSSPDPRLQNRCSGFAELSIDFHCPGNATGLGYIDVTQITECVSFLDWYTDLACAPPPVTTTTTTTTSTSGGNGGTAQPTTSGGGDGGDGGGGGDAPVYGALGGGIGGVLLLVCCALCLLPAALCLVLVALGAPVFAVVVLAVVVAGVAASVAGGAGAFLARRRRKRLAEQQSSSASSETEEGRGSLRRSGSGIGGSLAALDVVRQVNVADLKLHNKIGEGNFGVVYRGTWRGTTEVAIKVIKLKGGDDPEEMARVRAETEHEVEVMHRVGNHRNVVQFLGMVVDEKAGELYTVTSFYPKGSLHDLLVKGKERVEEGALVRMARDAAAGILHLHNEGVVHRDIAMRNCLVDAGGIVAISDFGTSRFFDANADDGGTTKTEIGPVRWMAPECFALDNGDGTKNAAAYSPASDAWSFGVMLYEMAARHPPYTDVPLAQIVVRVAQGRLRPNVPRGAPEVFARVMDGVFRTAPADRMTMAEVYRLLNEALPDGYRSDGESSAGSMRDLIGNAEYDAITGQPPAPPSAAYGGAVAVPMSCDVQRVTNEYLQRSVVPEDE